MRKKIKDFIDRHFISSWLILMIDTVIMVISFMFTYFLRYNLFEDSVNITAMLLQVVAGMPFFILAVVIFEPHRGIIRHSTFDDAAALVKTHLILSAGFFVISFLGRSFYTNLMIPYSVIVAHFFISVSLMIILRAMAQKAFQSLGGRLEDTVSIMIYGAGILGSIARSVIAKDKNIHYKIVGYLDDNPSLWGNKLGGIKIFSPEKAFSQYMEPLKVKEVILAVSPAQMDIERKREIVDLCLACHLKVRDIPDPAMWINGRFSGEQFRNIRIEDVLGRDPICLNVAAVTKGLAGKCVMVTGGAGSIGAEIVRQLVYLKPESIIIVDHAESALFEIEHEIHSLLNGTKFQLYVSDVTDHFKMRRIFNRWEPQIIYHAAAYKHVPLMELQPYEAIANNVGGTKNLADLAIEFGVEKFVMISTDKAVNPTNVMGASKRICEMYIQSLSQQNGILTQFITTRFGNVLGSNGSVIPLFKKQISMGGPVTLTHMDIIRYFMTIPEACQLVMEAGFMGHGGEIYLFDMGQPIKIYDLACRMISLSGFIPHEEIKIEVTGLRPGEKLFEELLTDLEEAMPTQHQKIMIGKIRPYDYVKSLQLINTMLEQIYSLNDLQLVAMMKEIVPEFVSCNSRFEILDGKPAEQERAD